MFSQLYWQRLFFLHYRVSQTFSRLMTATIFWENTQDWKRWNQKPRHCLFTNWLHLFLNNTLCTQRRMMLLVFVMQPWRCSGMSKAELWVNLEFSRNFVDNSIWFCGNSLISIADFISFFSVGLVWCKTKERCCVQSHYESTQSTPEEHSPYENSWNKHMWKFTKWNDWTGERECEELFAHLSLTQQ